MTFVFKDPAGSQGFYLTRGRRQQPPPGNRSPFARSGVNAVTDAAVTTAAAARSRVAVRTGKGDPPAVREAEARQALVARMEELKELKDAAVTPTAGGGIRAVHVGKRKPRNAATTA